MNLFSYDTLKMNNVRGLDGFKSSELSGTGRILLSLQTQAYTPWNFIGFRFGPFLNLTLLDMLGDSSSPYRKQQSLFSNRGGCPN